jgi:hypothetical protein
VTVQEEVALRVKPGLRLVLGALLAGCLLIGALVYRSTVAAKTNRSFCQKIHKLDSALQTIISDATNPKTLRRSAYYRDHPDELQRALDGRARQLELLRQADCFSITTTRKG